jgi:hypothetical protein
MIAGTIILARTAGAQPALPPPAAPFQKGTWMLTLSASTLAEAWNYNDSREEIYLASGGLRHELRDRLAVGLDLITAYVSQRGVDTYAMGWLAGAKWKVSGRTRRTLSLDIDVGMVRSEIPTPPRGTRFNYLFRTGLTGSAPLRGNVHAVAGIAWLHLSNNSLNGRGHNPDIQALGLTAGVLVPF